MISAACKTRLPLFFVIALLLPAGILSNPQLAVAQSQEACPLPAGGSPVAPPDVTAQQVENRTGSLRDFALGARDRFREQAQQATTPAQTGYFKCRIRQEDSPWRSGSTYLVTLTPDGRVFIHAKDMSLSGRKLNPSIYGAILRGLQVNPADLADPAAARAAFASAIAGNGGPFDLPDVPGASGYATVTASLGLGTPVLLLAGFDLDATHLAPEQIEHAAPAVTAADVVDRATLKAFVTEAGNYFPGATEDRQSGRHLESQDRDAGSQRAVAGTVSVYLYVLDRANNIVLFSRDATRSPRTQATGGDRPRRPYRRAYSAAGPRRGEQRPGRRLRGVFLRRSCGRHRQRRDPQGRLRPRVRRADPKGGRKHGPCRLHRRFGLLRGCLGGGRGGRKRGHRGRIAAGHSGHDGEHGRRRLEPDRAGDLRRRADRGAQPRRLLHPFPTS